MANPSQPLESMRAHPEHDGIIATHYLAIWESYETPSENLLPNARDIILDFLKVGRAQFALASFIAFDGNAPVGSVSCRLNTKSYPVVLKPQYSKEGYIWSVFTDPAYRGRGVARKLVGMAVEHLEKHGCTSVVLHSSQAGRPLYAGMGFELATEMRLKFEAALALSTHAAD